MTLWFILFFLVVAVSFLLAYQSMKDFPRTPSRKEEEYGLFLVRAPKFLDSMFLNNVHNDLLKEGKVLSVERLFKGSQSALVVFGPRNVLQRYPNLNLLELEDYTNVDPANIQVWETGLKNEAEFTKLPPTNIFVNLPEVEELGQFWWQVVLKPKTTSLAEAKEKLSEAFLGKAQLSGGEEQKKYALQIRTAVNANSPNKMKMAEEIQTSMASNFIKIPRPFTSAQLLTFYRSRAAQSVPSASLSVLGSQNLIKLF